MHYPVLIWHLAVAVQLQTLHAPFHEREQDHEEAKEEKYVCCSLILCLVWSHGKTGLTVGVSVISACMTRALWV